MQSTAADLTAGLSRMKSTPVDWTKELPSVPSTSDYLLNQKTFIWSTDADKIIGLSRKVTTHQEDTLRKVLGLIDKQ